jgi:hypothetical protein
MAMDSTPFWVRVYDLPLKLMSEGIAKKIGNMIGNSWRWTGKNATEWGNFSEFGSPLI